MPAGKELVVGVTLASEIDYVRYNYDDMQLNYATIHRQVTLVTITGQQEFSGLAPRVNTRTIKRYIPNGHLYVFPARASLSLAAPAGVAGYAIVPVSRGPAASRALRPGRVVGLGLAASRGLGPAAARSVNPLALHQQRRALSLASLRHRPTRPAHTTQPHPPLALSSRYSMNATFCLFFRVSCHFPWDRSSCLGRGCPAPICPGSVLRLPGCGASLAERASCPFYGL